MKDKETKKAIETEAIIKINKTPILKLLKYFLDNDNLIETLEQDELNYCNICYEIAKTFEDFFEETYISFNLENKDGHNEIIVKLVTINLEKKLKEFLDKNKILIMMSGTIHTPEVLTKIFGITEFKIIEAETKPQGTVTKIRTGYERNFRYSYLKQDILTRGQYLKALLRCIDSAKKPILVHVNSFSDLPTEKEKQYFKLENLITQEYLKEVQEKHKTGELIKEFKQGKTNILFSTKCTRGIDFPGETCNSIILTKYPYPNISSLFWRVLKKVHPDSFWTFYKDKAKREFLQKIYRGLRSKDDHIYLLSPDIQVVNETI